MSVEPLRIALSGTHGGGKTTLARLLAQSYKVEVIDVSRPTYAAQQLGYTKASEVPPEQMKLFQWAGLFEQIHQERLRCERPEKYTTPDINHYTKETIYWHSAYQPGFVADRSVIDFVAYYRTQIPEDQWDWNYYELAKRHAERYDAIILVPPNPQGVEDDNRRHTSDPLIIHNAIVRVLGEMNLMDLVVYVYEDGPEARLQEMLSELPAHRANRVKFV